MKSPEGTITVPEKAGEDSKTIHVTPKDQTTATQEGEEAEINILNSYAINIQIGAILQRSFNNPEKGVYWYEYLVKASSVCLPTVIPPGVKFNFLLGMSRITTSRVGLNAKNRTQTLGKKNKIARR